MWCNVRAYFYLSQSALAYCSKVRFCFQGIVQIVEIYSVAETARIDYFKSNQQFRVMFYVKYTKSRFPLKRFITFHTGKAADIKR